MARARWAVTRRKGRTGRLNRRKATSIASVMQSTGNAVMASLADVMVPAGLTGIPIAIVQPRPARAHRASLRLPPLIIRPSRLPRQTVGRRSEVHSTSCSSSLVCRDPSSAVLCVRNSVAARPGQTARRFSAADFPVRRSAIASKDTFCPSLSVLMPARSTALMCTKP
jgi:hypothetical protein